MIGIEHLTPLLDILVHLAQVVGIPVAIVLFFLTKRKERQDRERGTYDSLDEKYQNYLVLATRNPDLPLVVQDDIELWSETPSPAQKYRLDCCYLILTSILERAFLLYLDAKHRSRKDEWSGWEDYMRSYLAFKPYLKFWLVVEAENQFEKRFTLHMRKLRQEPQP